MAWKIEISATAEKQLAKFDKHVAKRIYRYLTDYISKLDDPRSVGEPLTGSQLGNFWRYRTGNYRIICDIKDKQLTVLVIRFGHRSKIYK